MGSAFRRESRGQIPLCACVALSYEFNQDNALLNDFPNPFKFENVFLFVAALVTASVSCEPAQDCDELRPGPALGRNQPRLPELVGARYSEPGLCECPARGVGRRTRFVRGLPAGRNPAGTDQHPTIFDLGRSVPNPLLLLSAPARCVGRRYGGGECVGCGVFHCAIRQDDANGNEPRRPYRHGAWHGRRPELPYRAPAVVAHAVQVSPSLD